MDRLFHWEKYARRLQHSCFAYCYDCKKQVPWKVGLLKKHLHLGKIPIPVTTREYFMYCGCCGDDIELSKRDFKIVESLHNNLCVPKSLLKSIEQRQLVDKSQFHLEWLKNRGQPDRGVPQE